MKLNASTLSLAAAMVVAAAALAGCSTTSSHPTEQGTSSNVVFPDMKDAWPQDGTFPNIESLRLLQPGMTKDQHYALIGRPHFKEGMFGVREWDYLFNFRTGRPAPNNVVKCQMKVLYDKDMLSRSYLWAPESCAVLLKRPDVPVVATAPAVIEKTTMLGADALFAFDRAGPNDLVPEGRRQVEALGRELAGMKRLDRVQVFAYTDRLGSAAYNQRLSQQRADTVKGLLVTQGVDARVISALGRGASNSVTQCGAMPKARLVECLAPDRRVEIRTAGVK
ncbi:OmpA/MotB:SmpA/OmlA [Cupriavidus taiwanensis]|uniref:OmpA/MotB:SmpA/OmlA n=1 Tax=Cupriavidus taiwanensis TaxID=164546 RepID=A0A375E6Y3_9BURK|nr:outer membrane protein assembly factor BamE [Cupriavidus taiwanensis]SOZ64439.1 OmpA/MotB:SmpA/OmlA [Cupriavidus taiwanensis]SOZ65143.1 OmpA/MotB:SmpA/OmlA [Cupriavidus taiwanensis]SOZ68807.1 OmpA/MotB:SmpA/OmlA [Cupriavidus taiwanensis]SPA08235.1 OmpA/MotB:SmpA/OmlA [Cupriavidus taiwanensis]